MDFEGARRIVTRRLDELYANERESPRVRPYGFDAGDSWAPLIAWDGVMGAYIILVNKRSGTLTPVSLPDFQDMPDPRRVGLWPEGGS